MHDTERTQSTHWIEPGCSSFEAYSRRRRCSSASKARADMTGGGGGRRSWNVPEAVSMNMGPVMLRTAAGRGEAIAGRGSTTRRPSCAGGGEGRAVGRGGGDRRLEPAIAAILPRNRGEGKSPTRAR